MTHDTSTHVHLPDPPKRSHEWADEHSAYLRELLTNPDNRLSYPQVAALVNEKFATNYTKNACIGRALRMKLSTGNAVGKHVVTKPRKPRKSRAIIKIVAANGNSNVKRMFRTVSLEPEPFVCQPTPELEMLHLNITELGDGMCRYASNNSETERGHTFCGLDVKAGKPYCELHSRLAYLPPRPIDPNSSVLLGHARNGVFGRRAA